MKLMNEFFNRQAIDVAKDLLGKILVVKNKESTIKVRLVEVEAYTGEDDKACHTYGGRRTQRTETMYKKAGTIYVYLIYGMHNMLNIVTGQVGEGQAVLIRGAEPIEGLDQMAQNRYGKNYNELNSYQRRNLTSGPGKLSQALGIDRSYDNMNLYSSEIYIEDDGYRDFEIKAGKRIGIDYAEEAKDYLYRFFIPGNKYLSVKD